MSEMSEPVHHNQRAHAKRAWHSAGDAARGACKGGKNVLHDPLTIPSFLANEEDGAVAALAKGAARLILFHGDGVARRRDAKAVNSCSMTGIPLLIPILQYQ